MIKFEEIDKTVLTNFYCKKRQSHSVINDGDENLVMFCIVPVQ